MAQNHQGALEDGGETIFTLFQMKVNLSHFISEDFYLLICDFFTFNFSIFFLFSYIFFLEYHSPVLPSFPQVPRIPLNS